MTRPELAHIRVVIAGDHSGGACLRTREALTNVERHTAASAVALSMCFEPGTALLTVQDDGAGVSPLDAAYSCRQRRSLGCGACVSV